MEKTQSKSFTLLELLVVIAIIGLLVSILGVAFVSGRNKAKDKRAVVDMGQIRIGAERYFLDQSPNSYTDLSCTNPSNMVTICVDINKHVGKNPVISATTSSYCAKIDLIDAGSENWYCIDNIGRAKFSFSDPPCTTTPPYYACE